MTEAMPFLRKLILLSYDPRPWNRGGFKSGISIWLGWRTDTF